MAIVVCPCGVTGGYCPIHNPDPKDGSEDKEEK